MKDLFSWKFPIPQSEIEKLWDEAIFVFDTNFLLSFYEVSYSTYEEYKRLLSAIESRIWIPYQVADEFLSLREETIKREKDILKRIKGILKNWYEKQKEFQDFGLIKGDGKIAKSELQEVYKSQQKFHDELKILFNELQDKLSLKMEESKHLEMDIEKDEVLNFIFELFDGKVGNNFDDNLWEDLYREGENRFLINKPPGFKDANKTGIQKYGDFILWKQILEFSKLQSHSIIFITNDEKSDWWSIDSNNKKSPHFELRQEFKSKVKKLFWMYSGDDFLKEGSRRFNVVLSEKSIRESEEITKSEEVNEDSLSNFEAVIDSSKFLVEPRIPSTGLEISSFINQRQRKLLESMNTATNSAEFRTMIQQHNKLLESMSAAIDLEVFSTISQQNRKLLESVNAVASSPGFREEIQRISAAVKNLTDSYKYPNL